MDEFIIPEPRDSHLEAVEQISGEHKSRSRVITTVRSQLSAFDSQQEQIGKTIPPGSQRIRGIAGSGKTVLLCQKAAHMHLLHPDWDIALVFFTRSLYDLMIRQVNLWLERFSKGEVKYDPQNSKLRVFHAWGARDKTGLYRTICQAHGVKPFRFDESSNYKPPELLADVVTRLLETTEINPMFDAILIDEGQDLVVRDELKFQGKQPIYWMAWQALRPVDSSRPDVRRLIWAYDEAQSLHSLKIPTASELFGSQFSRLVIGQYPGGIPKSVVMKRCYRTPGPILTVAHAIGMGLLRPEGMLSGFTRQRDWEAIGYQILQGSFSSSGQTITLYRPPENSPNPVPQVGKQPVLEFETYSNRIDELTALAADIRHNLEVDGLNKSRDILVVVLNSNADEALSLETEVAEFLMEHNIDIYVPTAKTINVLERNNSQRNHFWHDGGITVSLIHRVKGNEADMVYVVGFDNIAKEESSCQLRNQVFVALTRSRGWIKLSGIGHYPMYEEMRRAIESGDTFTFTYQRPSKWDISTD